MPAPGVPPSWNSGENKPGKFQIGLAGYARFFEFLLARLPGHDYKQLFERVLNGIEKNTVFYTANIQLFLK